MSTKHLTDIKNYYGNSSYMDANPDLYWKLSEITDFTPEMMRELIEKETGVNDFLPSGRFVLLKHYVKPKGTIELPKSIEEDTTKFSTKAGLVLAFGPAAYREKKENPAGSHCIIGQYAQFKRYENEMLHLNGHTCSLIYDYRILSPIHDPSIVDTGW